MQDTMDILRRGAMFLLLLASLGLAGASDEPASVRADLSGLAEPSEGFVGVTADGDLLTIHGEVPIDHKTGQLLPEELDDGELEAGDRHIEWTYTDQTRWSDEYPQCRGRRMRQSPIDIQTDKVLSRYDYGIEFIDYDQEVEFEIKNTHHSVSLTPIPSLATPSINLTWMPGEYFDLQEVHFHWGDHLNRGSEHMVDGEQAAAEMHMVHYKRGINKAHIGTIDNSVVVVGVFIQAEETRPKLDRVIKSACKVSGTDEVMLSDEAENLINLLPDDKNLFFTYNGSLTTPPCYETVTWVVMGQPTYMSNSKLVELSNLEAKLPGLGRAKISSNHRAVQPLLDRPVYVAYQASEVDNNKHMKSNPDYKLAMKRFWGRVKRIGSPVRSFFRRFHAARDKLAKEIQLYEPEMRDINMPMTTTTPSQLASDGMPLGQTSVK